MDRHDPSIARAARRRARAAQNDSRVEAFDAGVSDETPTQKLDRLIQTAVAPVAGNLSPIALSLAFADWAWHWPRRPAARWNWPCWPPNWQPIPPRCATAAARAKG